MLKAILWATLIVISLTKFGHANSLSKMDGFDVFGSKRISASLIQNQYKDKLEQLIDLKDKNSQDIPNLKKQIEESIQIQYGFVYVDIAMITYFQPNPGTFVTVDVVENDDVKTRMNFLPAPKGFYEDPDGLIALWSEYLELAFSIQRAGEFEYPKSCPVWHCTHGFEHPKLLPYLEQLNTLVQSNEKKLVEILHNDSRPHFRGNAAYLLAHLKNGHLVTQYVLDMTRDSSEFVRNNAVRVLSAIAASHPEIHIPVETILQVLKFPNTTDRNKAGVTLMSLSKKPENKKIIISEAGQILLEMLKLQQPNNHDPAFEIFKNLSGKNFGERNYEAWEKWLRSNQ